MSRSKHLDFARLSPWLITLVVVLSARAAAAVQLNGPAHVFGGTTNRLTVRVRNELAGAMKADLSYQVFQLSRRLSMPVGDSALWRQVIVPPESSRRFELALSLPEVRTTTHFRVTWFSGENTPAGQFDLTAHPRNLLSYFRKLIEANAVAMWDSENRLRPQMTGLELRPSHVSSAAELERFRGSLLIFVQGVAGEKDARERMSFFHQLNKRNIAVIFFYDDSGPGMGHPLIFYGMNEQQENTLLAPISIIAGLRAPEQQAWLARLLTCVTRQDPTTLISHHEY